MSDAIDETTLRSSSVGYIRRVHFYRGGEMNAMRRSSYLLVTIAVLATTVSLGACRSGSSTKTTNAGEGGANRPTAAAAKSAGTAELQGSWNKPCKSELIETISFSGDTFHYTETSHQDSECKKKLFVIDLTGTYTVTGPATSPSGAQNLDEVFTTATITPADDAAAKMYNSMSYCGMKNWTAGEAVDLMGKTCGQIHFTDPHHLDIYKISNGKLSLGNMRSGSMTTRPNAFEPTSYSKS